MFSVFEKRVFVSVLESATMRRVSRRLIPLLMICYVIAYLDRFNVSVAALTMNDDLGITPAQFGLGSGLFFVTYVIFEIPSNLMLAKVGARRWIARIMLTWGIISGCMALVTGANSFYAMRLILGIAEAGFTPGIVYYLARWYPVKHRSRAMSRFYVATALASVIGAPLSGLLLELDGVLGLAGWRWLFIVEALPAVVLAFVVVRMLTDDPKDATWLPDENREWLTSTLADERAQLERLRTFTVPQALRNPGVLLLAFFFFLYSFNSNGLTIWMPQVIEGGFAGVSNVTVSLLTAIPYACAVVGMLLVGHFCDKSSQPHLYMAVPITVGGVLLALSPMVGKGVLSFTLLCLATGLVSSTVPAMWKVATSFLTGTAAAAAIALVNSIANIAGFLVPPLIGRVRETTESFTLALLVVAAALVLAGVTAMVSRPFTTPERLAKHLADEPR